VAGDRSLENRSLESRSDRSRRRVDGAILSEVLEPDTVVELGVVLLDKTLVIDLHEVDASHRKSTSERKKRPSPCDGVAAVPDVQSGDGDLRLENTLTIVESGLVGECNRANLMNY
jgi:hypothetical protein